jgi:uncharacterized membrane protein YgcG
MIQRSLSLALSLWLALGPAIPAFAAGPVIKSGQGPTTAPILAVAHAFEQGNPTALRTLAAQGSPAAGLAVTLAAQPNLLANPQVRAQAEAAFGAAAVAQLAAASAALQSKAASDPAVAAAVADMTKTAVAGSAEKTQAAFTRIAAELGTMKEDEGASVAAGPAKEASVSTLSKAPRRSWLRRTVAAVMLGAGLMLATPDVAVAQVGQKPNVVEQFVPFDQMLAQVPVASEKFVRAADINDVIAKGDPSVHLYIIGDRNDNVVDDAKAKAIAAFLKDKSWYVVLVANPSGEHYRNFEGRDFYGIDAVDFGTGQGLYGKGGMTPHVHPVTGEKTTVIFTFVMSDKAFFFRGSDAMRSHGMDVAGGRQFVGDLQNAARNEMKATGDIEAAIKAMVTKTNADLELAINADVQNGASSVANARASVDALVALRAEFAKSHPNAPKNVGAADVGALNRAVAEGQRLLDAKKPREARTAVASAKQTADAAIAQIKDYQTAAATASSQLDAASAEIDAVEKSAEAYRKSHPKAAGNLARPDVKGWRDQLSAARSAIAKDPQSAVATAKSVTSQVRATTQGLAELAAAPDQISAAEKLLSQLQGRERAGSGQQDLTAAQQLLRQAAEDEKAGTDSWKANLARAKTHLTDAEQAIDAADAAAARNRFLFWLFTGLATLLTLGTGIFLNRRAASAGRKAAAELKKWDDILETKLDKIIDELDTRMDAYVGAVSGEKSRGWTGETADVAAQVRRDAGFAKLLLAKARQVHDEATALVRPASFGGKVKNFFSPKNYRAAEALLATTPITFKPEDGLDAVFGRAQRDWRGDLYGEAKDYEAFSKSFSELMKEFNGRVKTVVGDPEAAGEKEKLGTLGMMEHSITQSGAIFDAAKSAAEQAAQTQSSLANADKLFALEKIYSKSLPAAQAIILQARDDAKTNPIKGVFGGAAEANRIVAEASSLVKLVQQARGQAGHLTKTDATSVLLEKNSVATGWVVAEKTRLSDLAEKMSAELAKSSVAAKIEKLSSEIAAIEAKTADALKGAEALTKVRAAIAKSTTDVAAARETLSQGLNLPADKMMREKDLDPTDFLAAATKAADKTDDLLSEGKLDEAKKTYDEAMLNHGRAEGIRLASLKSLETHSAVERTREAETDRLNGLVPARKKVLDSIVKDFDAAVLKLASGDATHPNSNGTILDNIEEAETATAAAAAKRAKALKEFEEGRVLSAADLLSQALAHQQIAEHRLNEITEKRTRLDNAVADNGALRLTLEGRVSDYRKTVAGDAKTMRPTITLLEQAKTALEAAAAQVDAKKGNPFTAGAALAAVVSTLDSVWTKAKNDWDAHAEVVRSLDAARKQLDAARAQERAAEGDGITDSPAIDAAQRDLAKLEKDYADARRESQIAHNVWPTIDKEADRITNEAAKVAATLKNEIAEAANATSEISRAASKVSEATNWSGSYGVSIPGSPGSGELSRARSLLNSGDYDGAVRAARSAYSTADNAIDTAVAEVNRRRREEEERQRREAEERRRREREEEERRQRSSGGGGGGFGGGSGSSGGGWGGSSSGNSRGGW